MDAPYRLFDAIYKALVILSWEELPSEDQPPEYLWLDNKGLREWFKAVKARHGRDNNADTQIEDPVQNPATKGLKR